MSSIPFLFSHKREIVTRCVCCCEESLKYTLLFAEGGFGGGGDGTRVGHRLLRQAGRLLHLQRQSIFETGSAPRRLFVMHTISPTSFSDHSSLHNEEMAICLVFAVNLIKVGSSEGLSQLPVRLQSPVPPAQGCVPAALHLPGLFSAECRVQIVNCNTH